MVENINHSNIKLLKLQGKKIGNKSANALAFMLTKNNTLESLNVSHNQISVDGAKALASALGKNRTLEELDVSHNVIQNSGAISFAKAIAKSIPLQFLHLENNKITKEGAQALLDAYRKNLRLKSLTLVEIADVEKNTTWNPKIIDEITKLMQKNNKEQALLDFREVRIGKPIGGGSYSTVYEGIFRNHKVAIKQPKDEKSRAEDIKRFEEEANIMASFKHENVVKFCGYYKAPRYSIVMGCAELNSLGSFLKDAKTKGTLIPIAKIILALDMANGLNYMHDQGVLHRDFKPDNVLLNEDVTKIRAMVSDFGFSSYISAVSSSKKTAGKSKRGSGNYKAPEIRGIKLPATRHTIAADVYSYGATLFTLVFEPKKLPAHIDQSVVKKFNSKLNCTDTQLNDTIISCCNPEQKLRPKLSDVIEKLNTIMSFMNYRISPPLASSCSSLSPCSSSSSSSSLSLPPVTGNSDNSIRGRLSSLNLVVSPKESSISSPPEPATLPTPITPSYTALCSSTSLATRTNSLTTERQSKLLTILDNMLVNEAGGYELQKIENHNKWNIKKTGEAQAKGIGTLRIINGTQVEFYNSNALGDHYLPLTRDPKYSSLFSYVPPPKVAIKRKFTAGAGSIE